MHGVFEGKLAGRGRSGIGFEVEEGGFVLAKPGWV